ncbi:hypothetical protein [Microbacterium sp. NPDC055683]
MHLFCGGTSSYVVALRMGGNAPHLGLVVTAGALSSYSIERDLRNISNDRGCFVLHPAPLHFVFHADVTGEHVFDIATEQDVPVPGSVDELVVFTRMRCSPCGRPLRVRTSLDEFVDYFRRELIDAHTGESFNDFGRDGSFRRLYNASWYATFLLMLYRLDGDVEDARTSVRILQTFYAQGGRNFYPLEIPIVEMCAVLTDAGLADELAAMCSLFREHAEQLVANGTNYPPSEVNYEQSIVAPAVEIFLQTSLITGDVSLRDAAESHIRALEQFQGMQPDYHLNEVAVRHWDGYWFGKNAQYGDAFPHYWNALTGNAFALLHDLTGEGRYAERASRSFRGVLPLIFDDGRASCAYVFPHSVNGVRSRGYDPYANDQDWGLVFALRQHAAGSRSPLL